MRWLNIYFSYGFLVSVARGQPTATVKNGTYVGVHNDHYNVDAFLAIPFAQPPIGPLRLSLPVSLNSSFPEKRRATAPGPACVQFQAATINRPMSEDCLSINVYRPAGYEDASLPVLVWIYGGGYTQGSNYDPRYNLTFLVAESAAMGKPMVAANINYRLNGFGFLDSDAVRKKGLTNLGLHDQRLALAWIQENIAAFGGDPSKVTIWGQSAGAGSVGAQLLAYGGRNDSLFRAAIADSGGPAASRADRLEESTATFNDIVRLTSCDDSADAVDCLRRVSVEEYTQAINETGLSYGPVVDGTFLSELASDQLRTGQFLKVPLIIGSNTDEGTQFVGSAPTVGGLPTVSYPDEDAFLDAVKATIHDNSTLEEAIIALSALYPDIPAIGIPHSHLGRLNDTFGAQYKRVASFQGDFATHRCRRFTSQSWSQHHVPVYSYLFDQWPIGGLPDFTGTTHFTDIQLLFHNLEGNGYLAPWYPAGSEFEGQGAGMIALSRLMSRMWISFVHDLTPNNHGLCTGYKGRAVPEWPVYAAKGTEAAQGYGENLRFGEVRPSLAVVEQDTWRAEAIGYLIANSKRIFGI